MSESATVVARKPILGNRSGRLMANIVSGWCRMFVTITVGLVATPILVKFLGRERFGTVRVAEQWFAYLDFLSFGMGAAISVLLLKATTSGSEADAVGTIRTGMRLLTRQLRWILPAAVGLILAFPIIFDLPPDLRTEFYWAAPAVVISVIVMPFGVFRSTIEARQQGYVVNLGLALQAMIVAGLGIAFAAAGFGLTGQIWAGCLGLLTFNSVCVLFLGYRQATFSATPPKVLPSKEVWRLQWPLLITGIGNQLNLLSDTLFAGAIFGVCEAGAFILTQRLLQMATTVSGSLNGVGTWAGLVELRARVGQEAFSERVAEASKLNVGLNLLVLGPVLACNGRFVGLWVGDEYYAGNAVTTAIVAQLVVFHFLCMYSALIDSLGETKKRVWVSTLGTGIKIALLIPMTYWFGLAGLPLATVIGYICTDAWFCPRVICRDYGVSGRKITIGLLKAIIIGGGWAAACYAIGNRSEAVLPGWIGLIFDVVSLELFGLLLGWRLLLNHVERSIWTHRLKSWITSPKAIRNKSSSTDGVVS